MVTVRTMTADDVPAVSAIRVSGWQTAYAGIVPRSYLDAMTVEADVRRRRRYFDEAMGDRADLVAVDTDGRVVGWACLGRSRDAGTGPDTGELHALYVQPSLTGTGIGRTLLEAAHARADAVGLTPVVLWVLADNTGARRFYERAGYAVDGAVQSDDYDGVSVPEVRYRRTQAGG